MIGLFAVICWGVSAPTARYVGNSVGIPAFLAVEFGVGGILGLLYLVKKGRRVPLTVFREPRLYLRWICFVLHELCFACAVITCSVKNVPFVILLNYLWPTFVLLFSMLLAGLRITRWWAFLFGSLLIMASLATEIAGGQITSGALFAHPHDRLAYGIVTFGAMMWGLYSASSRAYGRITGGGDVVPLFQLTLATTLPVSLFFGYPVRWELGLSGTSLFLLYSFFLFLAFRAWDIGMREGNVVILSLSADFIPWLSIGASALFLGVPIETHTIVSALGLVMGAMVTRLGTLPRPSM